MVFHINFCRSATGLGTGSTTILIEIKLHTRSEYPTVQL